MPETVITAKEIRIGDRIAVCYSVGDMGRTTVARIGRIDKTGAGLELVTRRGYIVLTIYKSGETEPRKLDKIVLLDRKQMDMTTLPMLGEEELVV